MKQNQISPIRGVLSILICSDMVKKVGVIGKGTMGNLICRVFDNHNIEYSQVGQREFEENYKKVFELHFSDVDFLIESVSENISIKRSIFSKILELNSDLYIGSTTSSYTLKELNKNSGFKENIFGLHFMNPPTQIKEIELSALGIIPQEILDFLEILGFNVTLVPDYPGYILNSILFPFINSAAKFIEVTGMEATKVDSLFKNVCGHRLGPLQTIDLIGVDVVVDILENLHRNDPEIHAKPSEILHKMLEQGILGRKSKKGFYSYK